MATKPETDDDVFTKLAAENAQATAATAVQEPSPPAAPTPKKAKSAASAPPAAKESDAVAGFNGLSRNNQAKLAAATQHLAKMFMDAAGPQVGERKFWGRISLEIPWEDGEASVILPEISARDRVVRTGR